MHIDWQVHEQILRAGSLTRSGFAMSNLTTSQLFMALRLAAQL